MASNAPRAVNIPLGGMTCGHCVATVEKALLGLDGVQDATADLASQSAQVNYDPAVASLEAMQGAVAAVGYAPKAETNLVSIGAATPKQAPQPLSVIQGIAPAEETPEESRLLIEGMTCASCVSAVERSALRVPGVKECEVSLTESSARVVYAPRQGALEEIASAIRAEGYGAEIQRSTSGEPQADHRPEALVRRLVVAAAFTVPLLVLAMSHGLLHFPGSDWVQFALALPVMLYGGAPFFAAAWNAARHFRADMNTLVAVGTGTAFAYSAAATVAPGLVSLGHGAPVYFETAAAIVTLVLAGRVMETRARRRTADSIRKLLALQASTVRVRRESGEAEIPLADVAVGDLVVVRPGERIPVDGTLVEGGGAVDESPITGESVPVDKQPGSRVVSGSLSTDGFLVFRAEKVGRDTALSRIIAFVRRAQGSKAPAARLADRIAAVFVPAIFVVAAITFAAWLALGPEEERLRLAISNAVSVLIIACPCALGLATPAALAVAIGRAAEHGILVRDGKALESARRIDSVAFDKTGTLTLGQFAVTDIETFDSVGSAELLATAGSIERQSEHPIAAAIAAAAGSQSVDTDKFRALPGAGASAAVNGKRWLLGKRSLLADEGIDISAADDRIDRLEGEGKTVVLAAVDGTLAGAFALRDTIRPESREAAQALHERGVTTLMISGDNAAAANAIGREAGIMRVLAPVLPVEKSAAIQELQAEGRTVAMIGDGINDAPALAQADLGIAIGAGTDIAMETADIVLVRSDPRDAANVIELAKRTQRAIVQNYCWAFGYNILGVPVAAGVLYPWTGLLLSPIIASAAMALSSLSVLFNSLRLRRALAS